MIFSELYSAYYHTVAEILKHATDHAVGKEELRTIIKENAFEENPGGIKRTGEKL